MKHQHNHHYHNHHNHHFHNHHNHHQQQLLPSRTTATILCLLISAVAPQTPEVLRTTTTTTHNIRSAARFFKADKCDILNAWPFSCKTQILGLRTSLECLATCGRKETCIGASWDSNSGLCIVYEMCYFTAYSCVESTASETFWAAYCVHGVWKEEDQSCECFERYFGDRCEHLGYWKDCSFLITAGYLIGHYRVPIDPDQDGTPLSVTCYIRPPNYHAVTILNNEGREMDAFNKTFQKFQHGFEDPMMGKIWGGLNLWMDLSNAFGYSTLEIHLVFEDFPLMSAVRIYEGFVISYAGVAYPFTYKNVSTSSVGGPLPVQVEIGECMLPLANHFFTAIDRDADRSGLNCASVIGAGWWYSFSCVGPCHLLGAWTQWGSIPQNQRLNLALTGLGSDMNSLYRSIRRVAMYIRKPSRYSLN